MTKTPIWIVSATLLLAAGCGASSKIVPVSGKVTLDGKPLANAHVAFQPIVGSKRNVGVGSYGVTDASGRFELKTFDTDQPGAIVGQHRVEINVKAGADDDRDPKLRPPPKILPMRYNRESELQFEVKAGGTSEANFDLKSQ